MCIQSFYLKKGYGNTKNVGPTNLSSPNQKPNSIIDSSKAARSITFAGSGKGICSLYSNINVKSNVPQNKPGFTFRARNGLINADSARYAIGHYESINAFDAACKFNKG